MPTKFLTKEDIIETTGAERPEELEDLEILFLTFDELSALQCCPNLRRLTLIDNGLRRISNLFPVSMSLQILCLCDQSIEIMENLNLPNLRELHLHRNQIRRIDGLEGCPRLKKLWLFQNQINDLSGLEAVPELEELWLQANEISSLSGIEMNPQLTNLGLAGNKIGDLREVRKLTALSRLKDVSFTDIHFGRCPIADEDGYRQYIVLQLRQVRIFDGVKLKNDAVADAEDVYFREMTAFHESLQTIEEVYQKNLRTIDLQHQSRESYSQVLEKEMTIALKELQSLVDEGRKIVKKEIDHCEHLVESNLTSLQSALQVTERKTEASLVQHTQQITEEYYHAMQLVHLLEMVECNHSKVMHMLTDVQQTFVATSKQAPSQQQLFAYQYLGNNAADFVLIATLLDTSRLLYNHSSINNNASNSQQSDLQIQEAESTKNTPRNRRAPSAHNKSTSNNHAASAAGTANSTNNSSEGNQHIVTKPLELARLYRVVRLAANDNSSGFYANYRRLFTVITIDMLQVILQQGWEGLSSTKNNSNSIDALLFSEDAELLACLYEDHVAVQQLQVPLTTEILALQDRADEDIRRVLKSAMGANNKNNNNGEQKTHDDFQWNPLGKAVILLSCHAAVTPAASGESNSQQQQVESLVMMTTSTASATVTASSNQQQQQQQVATIAIPQQRTERSMLLEELHGTSKTRTLLVRNRPTNTFSSDQNALSSGGGSSNNHNHINNHNNNLSKIYTLPISTTSQLPTQALIAEFVALAISHQTTSVSSSASSTNTASSSPVKRNASASSNNNNNSIQNMTTSSAQPLLKNLEGRLELLLLPTHHVEEASQLLSSYEQESQMLLKRYVDQLLEGVDANQAHMLRQAEEEMLQQEVALKSVREEIEKERRGQENTLRDLKNQAAVSENNGNAGGGGSMQGSGSAKQLRARRG